MWLLLKNTVSKSLDSAVLRSKIVLSSLISLRIWLGTRNTIPANSYVYCSFESLKVFDRLERLEEANDKVALVKLGEGAPLLRQVIFDSNHLILRAWNDKVSDMIFPISKGSIGVYGSRDYVSMPNGELLYAEAVEIYGISYEYAKTIDVAR